MRRIRKTCASGGSGFPARREIHLRRGRSQGRQRRKDRSGREGMSHQSDRLGRREHGQKDLPSGVDVLMANVTTADCVVIGAGFAGAATAYHLTRNGARNVVVLEQEAVPGVHSSGRNASMVRQVVADAAFLRSPPPDFPEPPRFEQNGSMLLGSGEGWRRLARDAEMARGLGMSVECWTRGRAGAYVPALEGAEFEGAVWCATDGVVDIHALLTGYLKGARAAGAESRYRSRVRSIDVHAGRVAGVATDDGTIKTDRIVDAAGPWALTVAGLAGAVEAPLQPCRRHLYVTSPMTWVDRKWPFVWDVTHEFYFRPDSS